MKTPVHDTVLAIAAKAYADRVSVGRHDDDDDDRRRCAKKAIHDMEIFLAVAAEWSSAQSLLVTAEREAIVAFIRGEGARGFVDPRASTGLVRQIQALAHHEKAE